MDAANRAVGGARLRRREFAPDVVDRVVVERRSGSAALLRAVMDQAVLADVKVARAGAAAPFVRLAVREVVLEARDSRIQILHHLPRTVDRGSHLVVHLPLARAQRLQMSGSVVDDADRGGESEFAGARVYDARIIGILDPAAEHRVDVDVERGVGLQILKLAVEDPQTFLRHLIWFYVVD